MMKVFLLLVSLAIAFSVFSQEKKAAVFDSKDSDSTGMCDIFREVLSEQLTKSQRYKVVERALIKEVFKENKYQARGLVDDNKISELGKQIGADYVCVSMIRKIENGYFITAKLVDVLTASVELQNNKISAIEDDELYKKMQELAKELFASRETVIVKNENQKNNINTQQKKQPIVIGNYGLELYIFPEDIAFPLDYQDAVNACENLNEFGFSDWRLPTYKEAELMYLNKDKIKNLAGKYWRTNLQQEYYIIDFDAGYNWKSAEDYQIYKVRPVRNGNQPPASKSDN